jgi:hypothetical protein
MMRAWGRVYNEDGTYYWAAATTDAQGDNSYVYITQLIQWLKLNLGESPFYANAGIPARRAVATDVSPDFYVLYAQQQFAQFFAMLNISKINNANDPPTYQINLITFQGVPIQTTVPV